MAYSDEVKQQAGRLYSLGANVEDIRQELDLPNRRVIYNWAKQFGWDDAIDTSSLVVKTSRRLNWLIEKPSKDKSKADWDELSHLGDLLIKLEKADAFRRGESPGSSRGRKPGQKSGTGKRRDKKKKNDVSAITTEMLDEVENRVFYRHQKVWFKAGRDPKTARRRFILKSRQIGATYSFAWEAFRTAIESGNDQIFISSTKAQAEQFKAYIYLLAVEHFEIELQGNPTVLNTENGPVSIHYLSPNSFANSRSGDVYFDEVFYTRSFKKMEKVAAPMATLDGFKKTYFGAPTAISHEAYELWSGKRFTKHNRDVKIDVSDHEALYEGRLDRDGFWRCVCTIDSAMDMGWDLAPTLDELRLETPDPKQFDNVYRCKFIDDSQSVFKLKDVLACAVDPLSWFPDFDADNVDRPAGDAPVSLGYDPAGVEDNAAISVLSFPQSIDEKFRLYEKQLFRGMVASVQAQQIVGVHRRFNVMYQDIDRSGPGLFVPGEVETALREADLAQPRTVAKQYSAQSKAWMVQKVINVIAQRRFEYDEDDKQLPLAFMGVRQSVTPKSGEITYYSTRAGDDVGHGDEFWSTAHAMMCEPLNPPKGDHQGGVYFAD